MPEPGVDLDHGLHLPLQPAPLPHPLRLLLTLLLHLQDVKGMLRGSGPWTPPPSPACSSPSSPPPPAHSPPPAARCSRTWGTFHFKRDSATGFLPPIFCRKANPPLRFEQRAKLMYSNYVLVFRFSWVIRLPDVYETGDSDKKVVV